MGFSRQEHLSGLPFPGYLPDPGIELMSFLCFLHWQAGTLTLAPPGKPLHITFLKMQYVLAAKFLTFRLPHESFIVKTLHTSGVLSMANPSPKPFQLPLFYLTFKCWKFPQILSFLL